jgi:putative flippase GtrA
MSPRSRAGVLREIVQFGLVGGVGLVIDVVVFNALRATVFSPASVHGGPIIAKTISTCLAIAANWMASVVGCASRIIAGTGV